MLGTDGSAFENNLIVSGDICCLEALGTRSESVLSVSVDALDLFATLDDKCSWEKMREFNAQMSVLSKSRVIF